MKKLSIVIAMYNAEDTIERCINSVLCIELEDSIEILIIDDGSSDNSLKICNKFAEKHENINVYSKENGGVSSARNYGLEVASGEYIWYVDSDDWINTVYLKNIISNLNKYLPDYYQIGFSCEYTKDMSRVEKYDENKFTYISNDEKWEYFLDGKLNSYACSHIVKRDVYNKYSIRYPVGRIFEDTAITNSLIECSDKIVIDDNICYCYYTNSNSLSRNLSLKKINDLLYACSITESNIQNSKYYFETWKYNCYFLNNYIQVLVYIYKLSCSDDEIKKYEIQVKQKIKELDKQISLKSYRAYCKRIQYPMLRYYVLYKFNLLKCFEKIYTMIKG